MNLRQSIHQHLDNLPENLQAEVFDFVLFLEQRQSKAAQGKPPARKCLAEMLLEIPDCGLDGDFKRVDEPERAGDVFVTPTLSANCVSTDRQTPASAVFSPTPRNGKPRCFFLRLRR